MLKSTAPRLYHIDAVNDQRRTIARLTEYPMTHAAGSALSRKLAAYPWWRIVFVEVDA